MMKLTITAASEALFECFDRNSELEILVSGFRFLEGPAWDSTSDRLVFSDIPGNGLYQWKESTGLKLLRNNSFLPNGNTFDSSGNLVTCEHATSRVSMTTASGEYIVLAERYQGKQLNSPNDVVTAPDGSFIFTDPPYGRFAKTGIPRPQELSFQGVYRIKKDEQTPSLLVADFDKPNGLCFSLDAKRLFINDTSRNHIRVFDVLDDGNLTGGAIWAELPKDGPGVPDGMRMSANGLLWCTGPQGLLAYDNRGALVGRITIPEVAANLAWGGPTRNDLYITATTTLYRIRGNASFSR